MQKLHEHVDLLTTTHEMNKAKVSVHMTVTSYSIHIYINVFYVVQHEGMCGLRVYTYFCLINSLVASHATVSTVLDRQSLLLERTRLPGRHSDRCPLSAVQETLVRITVFESRGCAVSTVPLVCPKSMQRRLTVMASHALSAHTGCQSPAVYTSTTPALPPLSVSRTSPSLWSTE